MVNKFDLHAHVTAQIIRAMEAGTAPWRKPWAGGNAAVAAMRDEGQNDLSTQINLGKPPTAHWRGQCHAPDRKAQEDGALARKVGRVFHRQQPLLSRQRLNQATISS